MIGQKDYWAPDRVYLDEILEQRNQRSEEKKKIRVGSKKILTRLIAWSLAITGFYWGTRSRSKTPSQKKWGDAISGVTGGHPEDMNGM